MTAESSTARKQCQRKEFRALTGRWVGVGQLILTGGFDNIQGRLESSPGRFLPEMLILGAGSAAGRLLGSPVRQPAQAPGQSVRQRSRKGDRGLIRFDLGEVRSTRFDCAPQIHGLAGRS